MNEHGFDTAGMREAGGCQADRDLEAFVAALGDAYPAASCDHCEADHVSLMLQEAHLLAEKGEPVARPASKADGPAEQVSGLSKWRRDVKSKLAGMTLGMKVGAGAVALVFAFTGVAFAGGLPHPVQHAVSGAAAAVGIQLPDPEEDEALTPVGTVAPEVDETDAIEAGNVDEIDANDATANDQNEVDAGDANVDENNQDQGDGEKARSAGDRNDHEGDAEEARSANDDQNDEADQADQSSSDDHESDNVEDNAAGTDD